MKRTPLKRTGFKKKKPKAKTEKLTPKEKAKLSNAEKEYKSKRKLIQDKLIKFATRIPIFMYLTDFREYSLRDVITQIEPGLFKRVTGIDVNDFELLVSIGVFNGPLMNDAVYKFKRYEDSSLVYAGLNKHEGENVGGFDTVISQEEYKKLYVQQQNSITESKNDFKVLDNEKIAPSEIINKDNLTTRRLDSEEFKQDIKKFLKLKEGDGVFHKTFGEGFIRSINEKNIIVSFGKAEKMFVFPDAFLKGFLSIAD
jgi:K+/H+ antiporter YhaU regulatory subunit KhtT